jgi:hypothetical protein
LTSNFEAREINNPEIGEEFRRLEEALNEPVDFAYLQDLHVEPTRPRAGMIAQADGSDWDPGYGAGLYRYDGSNWLILVSLNSQGIIEMPVLTSTPTSPATGWVAFADGSGWNPGAGAGVYAYHTTAWNHLG